MASGQWSVAGAGGQSRLSDHRPLAADHFAVTLRGFEHTANHPSIAAPREHGGAESGAPAASRLIKTEKTYPPAPAVTEPGPTAAATDCGIPAPDPDLSLVIRHWPDLPTAVRDRVVALVCAALTPSGHGEGATR